MTENHGVGGSIPPLGTIKINSLADLADYRQTARANHRLTGQDVMDQLDEGQQVLHLWNGAWRPIPWDSWMKFRGLKGPEEWVRCRT